jgi:hypothetical protein
MLRIAAGAMIAPCRAAASHSSRLRAITRSTPMNRILIASVVAAGLFSSFASAVHPGPVEDQAARGLSCDGVAPQGAVAFDEFVLVVARYALSGDLGADCGSVARQP